MKEQVQKNNPSPEPRRKRAADRSVTAEALQKIIFDNMVDIVALLDKDGIFQYVTPSIKGILGHDADHIVGRKVTDHVHPKDRKRMKSSFAEALKTGRQGESFRFRHADGRYVWLYCSGKTVRENGGNGGLVVGCRDVTAGKQAEVALRESERRWMDVIDFLPDATLAIDLDGKVIAWNRAIEDMTGVPAREMLGQGDYGYVVPFCGNRRPILIDFVLSPDAKGEREFSVVREHRDLLRMEWVGRLKGKKVCLWCKASPLYDSDGNVVGALESIRDITELRRKEKELEIKAGELQDLNAALRVLLKQRDGDRGELEDKILANIKQLVLPYLEKLQNQTGERGRSYLKVVESNLRDIISPFAHKLTVNHLDLTNKEIQVASLIKEGKTTKEISEIVNVSENAVNVYRHHIRKKIGLSKTQNLRSFLASYGAS